MTTINPSQILEANESFVCDLDGERLIISAGVTRIAAGHKLARVYPNRFQPIEDNLSYRDDATTELDPVRHEGRARTAPTRLSHKG